MTNPINPIRILNGALDEEEGGEIVLRGRIAPESFIHLQVDDYQREVAPLSSQSSILGALTNGGTLPDIELGMRGQKFKEEADGTFVLTDPVYIVDGLQRVSTVVHYLSGHPDAAVRLGAKIYFDTDKPWERERFGILNGSTRAKVSPNILLRNYRETSRAILMLYGLSNTAKDFVLHDRVSWRQRMTRGELISALTFVKLVGILHSHKAAGIHAQLNMLVSALDRGVDLIGIQNVRENMKTFFDLIDECWGIKRVQYRESAIYMRGNFLYVLARLLSDHTDFWRQPDEKKLFIEAPLKRKIAQFPINDPEVVRLAGSSGKAREMIYLLLRDHINSGKRTKRLTSRKPESSINFEEEEEQQTAVNG
ncbi:MAG: hypothetical protein AAB605_03675 [Patescibacteria group bacterium]